MKQLLAFTPNSLKAKDALSAKRTDATRSATNKSTSSSRSLLSMTFMPSTRPILALSWLLATNFAAQELPPSKSPSEEPSKPAPTEEESRFVQIEPLLVQFDSGFVFFGLQTSPASTNVIIEYSQDLKSWREDVPMLCLSAPPPPPIALIDRLGRAPGRNLRIIPLDSRGSNEGFCRSKVMTVTNVAPLGSVTADRAVSVKP